MKRYKVVNNDEKFYIKEDEEGFWMKRFCEDCGADLSKGNHKDDCDVITGWVKLPEMPEEMRFLELEINESGINEGIYYQGSFYQDCDGDGYEVEDILSWRYKD